MASVVLDTSVIIEYIDLKGSLHEQASAVFNAILEGRLNALIPHPVLAETFYVAARIYGYLGFTDSEQRAARLVEWLYRLPSVNIVGESLDLALEAGRVKLKYGLALTDCYVLAVSRLHGAKALFKRREREMTRKGLIDSLSREYDIVFLEDYA